MAFYVRTVAGESCDKCKSKEGDLLEVATTGRRYDQRNIIFIHERCLTKSIETLKKRQAKETVTKVGP